MNIETSDTSPPPSQGASVSPLRDIVEAMLAKPGYWLTVQDLTQINASRYGTIIRNSSAKWIQVVLKDYNIEATGRAELDGTYTLWVRATLKE